MRARKYSELPGVKSETSPVVAIIAALFALYIGLATRRRGPTRCPGTPMPHPYHRRCCSSKPTDHRGALELLQLLAAYRRIGVPPPVRCQQPTIAKQSGFMSTRRRLQHALKWKSGTHSSDRDHCLSVLSTTRRQFSLDTRNILQGLFGAQVHCRSDPAAQRTSILMN